MGKSRYSGQVDMIFHTVDNHFQFKACDVERRETHDKQTYTVLLSYGQLGTEW